MILVLYLQTTDTWCMESDKNHKKLLGKFNLSKSCIEMHLRNSPSFRLLKLVGQHRFNPLSSLTSQRDFKISIVMTKVIGESL